jgi:apolipoprotein N-acyltransferase
MKLRSRLNFAYVYALFGGALLALSFPSFNLFLFAWIALAPLLVLVYDRKSGEAFKAGLLFGMVYFFGTIYWIYYSLHHYGSISLVPSLIMVLLLSVYLSFYPAIFCSLFSAIMKKSDMPALFVAPVLWTSLEFVRSYALSGFPWSTLGYSQHNFPVFIQSADIIGVYGISFLVVAFNGALADVVIMAKRMLSRPLYSRFHTYAGWCLLFIALVANLIYGFYRLYQDRPGSAVTVAVVQGNIEQDKKWDASYQHDVTDIYKNLSLSVTGISESGTSAPSLVVWPETSVPFVFGADRELSEDLISFQRKLNTYLLFGSIRLKNNTRDKFSNSTVLLTKDGSVSYIYDKIHLVPFGEYVPLRRLFFFVNKLTVGIGDYVPGDSYARALPPFGSFGTPICYEIIFPGLVRKYYTKGGDFIVTITNDAWFGRTNGPYQHFSMAVFRAIENRKPVVRAANTGISGIIDSNGNVLKTTALFERTAFKATFKTDKTLTLYTKYGDMFSFFCIVLSLSLVLKLRKR